MCRIQSSLLGLAIATLALGQSATSAKRNLLPTDYAAWQNLVGTRISDDGHWLAYGVATSDGDPTLTVRNCDSKEKWDTPGGTTPRFSDDSKWCAYMLVPPAAVAERLRAEHKPAETKMGLRELSSGAERIFDRVAGFRVLKYGPGLMISRFRGVGKPEGGADVEFIIPDTGYSLTVGNVIQAVPNKAEDLVLLNIDSDSGEKGVQLLDLRTGTLKTLAWGEDDVQGLAWAPKADVAALLLGTKNEKKDGPWYRACIASNLRDVKPAIYTLDPATRTDFPKGKRIAPFMGTDLNADGTAIGFGIQDWNDLKKDDRKPEDKSNVQIWNTHDIRVMPTQILHAQADRQKSDLWAWRSKDNELKPVAIGEFQSAELLGDFEHAILIDDKPYRSSVTNGFDYADIAIVDPWTGKKTVLETKSHWADSVEPSRLGGYVAFYSGRAWWLADVATGKIQNLTGSLPHTFEESEDDHTVPEKPFADPPIWLKDDQGLVLGDDYDQFLVRPGFPGITELTHGRSDHRVYRLVPVLDDPDGIGLKEPFFFHVFDKDTKGAGFATSDSSGKGKLLVFDNVTMSGLHKAKGADRVTFTMGSYEKSPDAYVTNTAFSAVKAESHTNPQQAQFNWGHSELVEYKSRWGVPLEGALVYPADYVKGRRYPMVTYIYERESDQLNEYRAPNALDPYNVQILSQNGYFVLMPDIAYRHRRRPGEDAVDCLEPAVDAVFAKNIGVDSNRVGLMGHSWGAYETAFVTTVSKAFAVGVAGAPLTELTSMYNSFYWNSGSTDQEIFESSQGRMGVPFWEDPKAYIDDSPVWRSRERKAPLLFAAGDADGAVDWHQSLYLYNTLRRLGKDAVLLVYPGENHGLTRKAVRKDYSMRVREYLDVYLKGAKPEPWITTGVPYIHPDDVP